MLPKRFTAGLSLADQKKYPSRWDKRNFAHFITFTEVSSSPLPKPGP